MLDCPCSNDGLLAQAWPILSIQKQVQEDTNAPAWAILACLQSFIRASSRSCMLAFHHPPFQLALAGTVLPRELGALTPSFKKSAKEEPFCRSRGSCSGPQRTTAPGRHALSYMCFILFGWTAVEALAFLTVCCLRPNSGSSVMQRHRAQSKVQLGAVGLLLSSFSNIRSVTPVAAIPVDE